MSTSQVAARFQGEYPGSGFAPSLGEETYETFGALLQNARAPVGLTTCEAGPMSLKILGPCLTSLNGAGWLKLGRVDDLSMVYGRCSGAQSSSHEVETAFNNALRRTGLL